MFRGAIEMNLEAKVIEAAGGVVERITAGEKRIAVIRRDRYGEEWVLPKGKRLAGESWQETALREVNEELGFPVEITNVAGSSFYLANTTPKVVVYWLMRPKLAPGPFVPNDEARDLQWLTLPQAMTKLSHPEEQLVLQGLLDDPDA